LDRVNPFSASSLLAGLGPYATAGIFLVLFIETAVPIGFVLPGDTLLLTAGLLCATGHLSLPWVLAAATAGAIAGAQTGYLIGRIGERQRPIRHRTHRIERAAARIERLATRRGPGPALLAARFIPVARSMMGPLAGALNLPPRAFTAWQVTGALAWTLSTTLVGYAVGRAAPGLEHYLPVFLAVTALSLPIALACGYAHTRIRARHRTI
jgi:membrane-associated protein